LTILFFRDPTYETLIQPHFKTSPVISGSFFYISSLTMGDNDVPSRNARPVPTSCHKFLEFEEVYPLSLLRILHSNMPQLSTRYGFGEQSRAVCDAAPTHATPDPGYILGRILSKAESVIDDDDGTIKVKTKYAHSAARRNAGLPDGGRLFVEGGLGYQSLSKWVRHTLAHGLYWDIDMVNAHPVILLQLIKQYSSTRFPIRLDAIETYVANRDAVLQEFVECGWSVADAKRSILIVMYGGDVDWNRRAPHILQALKRDFDRARDVIAEDPSNRTMLEKLGLPAMRESGDKRRKEDPGRLKSRLLSNVLCEVENAILQSCLDFMKSECLIDVSKVVLCFDGFMVLKKDLQVVDAGLLQRLSDYVCRATGYEVKFLQKPMDRIMDLNGYEESFVRGQVVEDDKEAGRVLKQYLRGRYLKCGALCFYLSLKTNTWSVESGGVREKEELLKSDCFDADIRMMNSKGEGSRYSTMMRGVRAVVGAVEPDEDDELASRLWAKSIGKWFFKGGVYDCQEGVFRKEDPERDATCVRIPREFPRSTPELERQADEVFERAFLSAFANREEAEFYLILVARALAGHVKDKRWVNVFGERNSGKGVVTELIKRAFGPYVATFSSTNILASKGTGDAELDMKWLYPLWWVRIAFSNEIKMTETIDGNKLKLIAGGGDEITLRNLFQGQITIKPQATLFMNCNDLPAVDSPDALQTCVRFEMANTFVDEETYNKYDDDTRPLDYRLADNDIKTIAEEGRWNDAVVTLVRRYYRETIPPLPSSLIETQEALREDAGDDRILIRQYVECTKNDNDVTPSSELEALYKQTIKGERNSRMTIAKFRSHLKRLGGVQGRGVVNSKRVRVWKRLKIKNQEMD